jgi:hypothetical protein
MRDIIKSLAVGAAAGVVISLGMLLLITFPLLKTIVVGTLFVSLLVVTVWGVGEILRDLFK